MAEYLTASYLLGGILPKTFLEALIYKAFSEISLNRGLAIFMRFSLMFSASNFFCNEAFHPYTQDLHAGHAVQDLHVSLAA